MLSRWKRRAALKDPATKMPSRLKRRRGAVIVLFSGLVVLLLVTVTFSVDVAWMQLVRTELRSSTDAAAKAGAEALARFQSEDAARNAAIAVALKNTVAGRPLVLQAGDVQFGNSTRQGNGTWKFKANKSPRNAVRINAHMDGDQAVGLFFAPVFGVNDFTPAQSAVASQLDQDVVLVVDRSGSMCFDYSGIELSYPGGLSYLVGWVTKPNATLSRWAGLVSGVRTFLDTAKTTTVPPRVCLVTFASEINPSNDWGAKLLGISFPTVLTDVLFKGNGTSNYDDILNALASRGSKPMIGYTNIAAGIDQARTILNGNDVRPLAKKVIIVFTDGQWNQGRSPVDAAQDAYAEGIVIHTVTLLEGGAGGDMEEVARITGGRNLHARTQAELEAAFRELALTLPVVLTE
jgi:Flp pilus assembly protein TadG